MTQATVTPKHDLTEFIPMEKDLNYLPRSVDADLVEISKMPLAKRRPVYLLSEAATGKTSTVRNFAFEKKLPFLLIEVDASMNFNDLLYKVKLQNATATYEPGLLIKMIQQPSVILFDELASASAELFFKLHELLQERSIFVKELDKVFRMHEECYIFAASNFRNSLYIGNNKLNSALISRFMVKVTPDFSRAELEKIISYPDKSVKTNILDFYDKVKENIQKQSKKYVITIRHLQNIFNMLEAKFTVAQAMHYGFIDSIAVNNELGEMKAIRDLAVACIKGYKLDEVESIVHIKSEEEEF